ncbi:YidH family protein [Heyndrickxia coagulans]|uniref:YidH family protein n=1 Tax=Heyndrickxia coagulans TaxID=1398 RepID=UPI0003009867|nr:DUF202 domain-containing protein [Heyndrickxia coagulans]
MENQKKTVQGSVKFSQQHLANERTFLAWIRTAISIIGVGFLTTSLHFTIRIASSPYINTLAILLGIFACVIGFITGITAALQYARKRREIEKGIFVPANFSVHFLTIIFTVLIFMIFVYLMSLLVM